MDNDFFRILKPLKRGFVLVILAMIISVLAAKKYLSYVTPMYESTAMLKLADIQEGEPSANLFKNFDVFVSVNKIDTEIEVLKSTSLIEKALEKIPFSTEVYRVGAVRSVELFEDSPILIEGTWSNETYLDQPFKLRAVSKSEFFLMLPNENHEIKGYFGSPIKLENGMLRVSLNKNLIKTKPEISIEDTYEFEFLSREKLLKQVAKNLDIVSVEKEVPVIRINYKSSVPEKAALFVNTLSETYIRDYIENKVRVADTTVNFLKGEIDSVDTKLTTAEAKIQNYRDDNNIINITQETETDLRKIAQLKIQQSNIKMNLDAAKELNQYIKQGNGDITNLSVNFEAFNDLLSTEIMKNIKQLQAEKKELQLTYTPEHEKVKIIDSKIKDLTDYQVESIQNTQDNLQIKYNDISRDIQQAEQVFVGLPQKERILNILNREFNLRENSYNFLNEKRIEAEIARSAKISFHKVISKGEVPKEPVSPVRSIIIIVAAILGMLMSLTAIYSVHFFKGKVNDVLTIERNSDIPILFSTPFLKTKEKTKQQFSEHLMELELKEILHYKSILTITSYDDAQDHQFHVENLYKSLVQQGQKVLLIDAVGNADFLERTNILDISNDETLPKIKTDLEDFIVCKLKGYDVGVVNNVAVKDGVFAFLLMGMANQNIFVLDSRKTAEKSIENINILKEKYHLNNMWFVLNKVGYNPSIFKSIIQLFSRLKQ